MKYGLRALTFDVFGTILDIAGSITPSFKRLLGKQGSGLEEDLLWREFRLRQRIEQYQDTLLMLGHTGYHQAVRRALLYVLRKRELPFTNKDVDDFMEDWRCLTPFKDALEGLKRLEGEYQLVILSNGERWFLEHLAGKQIRFDFDEIFSVERVGVFKPHPAVYRSCAKALRMEPHELMMVSSNSFDVMGARASGLQAAWVKRVDTPYEVTPFQPRLIVRDFHELATSLL